MASRWFSNQHNMLCIPIFRRVSISGNEDESRHAARRCCDRTVLDGSLSSDIFGVSFKRLKQQLNVYTKNATDQKRTGAQRRILDRTASVCALTSYRTVQQQNERENIATQKVKLCDYVVAQRTNQRRTGLRQIDDQRGEKDIFEGICGKIESVCSRSSNADEKRIDGAAMPRKCQQIIRERPI